jgi:hypothetical protein
VKKIEKVVTPNLSSVAYLPNPRRLDGTAAHSTGRSKNSISLTIPTTDKDPMRLCDIRTTDYCVNFSVEIDLFGFSHFLRMMRLHGMSLDIRVLSYAQDPSLFIVNDSRYLLSLFCGHLGQFPLFICDYL